MHQKRPAGLLRGIFGATKRELHKFENLNNIKQFTTIGTTPGTGDSSKYSLYNNAGQIFSESVKVSLGSGTVVYLTKNESEKIKTETVGLITIS